MKNRILVLDDDEDFVALLRYRCNSIGAETVTVFSREEAMHLIQTRAVDLLCLDADLPSGIGTQVASEISRYGTEIGIPAIVLTEIDDLSSLHACRRIRAYYVRKSPTFWIRLRPVLTEFLPGLETRNANRN